MRNNNVTLYTHAQAIVSCFYFKAGDTVRIKYDYTASNGVSWFLCNDTVMYPGHHLTHFEIRGN